MRLIKFLVATFFVGLFSNGLFAAPLPAGGLKINFAPIGTTSPAGYYTETGEAFGAGKTDGSQTYGWVDHNGAPSNISSYARNRAPTPDADVVRETFLHMDHADFGGDAYAFQVALPNGDYRIIVQVGDAIAEGSSETNHVINAEGESVVSFGQMISTKGVANATAIVSVNDGMLNIDQSGGQNTKLHLLIIEAVGETNTPVVLGSTPVDGETLVEINTTISANFLDLPNPSANGSTSLNNDTITTDTVQLFEVVSGVQVLGSVNGTGGGDAINFTPLAPLKTNTEYVYIVEGVQDLSGQFVLPFTSYFTTGTDTTTNTGFDDVAFEKFGPLVTGTRYSSLTMGPDNRLYGLTITGNVHRWTVNTDGSLADQEVITTLQSAYGGASRLAIGLVFDPAASANNLVAYVTHSTFTFSGGPAYDGNISRLSGTDLQAHELVVTGLPRSVRDHLTNSITFRAGEPGVLYLVQGSNSAGGRQDGAWGNRKENLLSAACLRLDLNKLPTSLPLDVQTSDDQAVINNASTLSPTTEDGQYNPYYQDAPLTLYATGVRNAYDLIWHSNGQLYIPTNGTAGGSFSPASVFGTRRPDGSFYNGQTVPQVGPNGVQRDFLFRVDPNNPLGYYGHPNPLRGEFVMNRANVDVGGYSSNITPDDNYRGFAFDFAYNISPNGVIEYQSNAHHDNLRGALLVARYSGGGDIIALRPNGPDGDIGESRIGIPGLVGFKDPLEITEDKRYGNLYVSDYGDSELYLLRPVIPANSNATIYQAEDALLVGPQAASGYGTDGFADYINANNDYVEWTVNAATSGQYGLTFRYALSGSANRPLSLTINGNVIGIQDFVNTGAWTDWLTTTIEAQLVAGENKVRLTAVGSSGPNIDYLSVEPLQLDQQPPTITLNQPTVSAGNVSGEITATANDVDGEISQVAFYYDGNNLLGTVETEPYQFAWENAPEGSYSITAVATDSTGLETTSNAVLIVIDPSQAGNNKAPTITLNQPTASAGNVSGTITATANDEDGVVSQVAFYYDGDNLLDTVDAAPYQFVWENAPDGTYNLTAVATDDAGLKTTSNAITLIVDSNQTGTNQAPSITLTQQETTTGNVAGGVTAVATDVDGTITEVSFYYGGDNLLATDTVAPYQFNWGWGGAPDGTYTVTAVAKDNDGAQTTSDAIVITVDNSQAD